MCLLQDLTLNLPLIPDMLAERLWFGLVSQRFGSFQRHLAEWQKSDAAVRLAHGERVEACRIPEGIATHECPIAPPGIALRTTFR
jgi:hypothetical protein